MTNQTNNNDWKGGHSGHQCPPNTTPQQQHDHEQGRLQRVAEQQAAYDKAWKKNTK